MRTKSLNYGLRSGVLTDANQWVNTGWWYIDYGLQVIELERRAASDPAMADGHPPFAVRLRLPSRTALDGPRGLRAVDLASGSGSLR